MAVREPASDVAVAGTRTSAREDLGVAPVRAPARRAVEEDLGVAPVRAPARRALAEHVGVDAEIALAGLAGAAAGFTEPPAELAGAADRANIADGHQAQWSSRAANGRRTVTIRGHGAERNLPVARPALRRHERPGFKPDRAALWAVVLGLFLILVAAASAHAAVAHHVAGQLIR